MSSCVCENQKIWAPRLWTVGMWNVDTGVFVLCVCRGAVYVGLLL